MPSNAGISITALFDRKGKLMKKISYSELAHRLVNALKIEISPVTVAFSTKPPEGVDQYDGQLRFCQFLDVVREKGGVFYTDLENQSCKFGNYYLGLAKAADDHLNGEEDAAEEGYDLFETPMAVQRLYASAPTIPTGRVSCISYARLEDTPFHTKVGGMVVVINCSPVQALFLQRGVNYKSGKIVPGLTGPATCSASVVGPFLSGEMHYSLGSFGVRYFTKMKPDQVIVGIPMDIFPQSVDSLEMFIEGDPSRLNLL